MLANLTPRDLPEGVSFADLVVQHGLIEFMHSKLVPGFAEDDVILLVIMMVATFSQVSVYGLFSLTILLLQPLPPWSPRRLHPLLMLMHGFTIFVCMPVRRRSVPGSSRALPW